MSKQTPLNLDEKIAIFVTFGFIGAVLLWGFTRPNSSFYQSLFTEEEVEVKTEDGKEKELEEELTISDSSLLAEEEKTETIIIGEEKSPIPDDTSSTKEKEEAKVSNNYAPPVIPTPQPQPNQEKQPSDDEVKSETDSETIIVEETVESETDSETIIVEETVETETDNETDSETTIVEETVETETEETSTDTESKTPEIAANIQPDFVDVPESYWAYPFIKALQKDEIITMTEDKKYNPNGRITRAEYGELLATAFDTPEEREGVNFKDTSADSEQKISRAVKQKFLSGYPDKSFQPNQPITRVHVLLSLVNGLGLTSTGNQEEILGIYEDQADIPEYAKPAVVVATEKGLVVMKPNTNQFNPNDSATRGEVAAMIYQALVVTKGKDKIDSEYLVDLKQE